MGVYIPKMDMPKSCGECDFSYIFEEDGCLYCDLLGMVDNLLNERDDDCPFVEIPTPHGRLIDAEYLDMECLYREVDDGEHSCFELVYTKDEYQTVIESEE